MNLYLLSENINKKSISILKKLFIKLLAHLKRPNMGKNSFSTKLTFR